MAVYVISDIHGFYFRMMDVLNQANFDDTKDELYVLGDTIDRGPHNYEMIQWILKNISNPNIHFLLGNHEDMMLSVLDSNINVVEGSQIWGYNGGSKTYFDLTTSCSAQEMDTFINFVRDWPLFYDINVNDKRFLLVHAGLAVHGRRFSDDFYKYGRRDYIDIPGFETQWAQSLLWSRENWYYNISELPCDVVFGHTPTARIFEGVIWEESDREYLRLNSGLDIKGNSEHILHINKKKHAIDTGRRCMGLLRLDDMQEFYSSIEEKTEED